MPAESLLEQVIGHDNLKISVDGDDIFRHILKKRLVLFICYGLNFIHLGIPLMQKKYSLTKK